jgi:tetratricopeptide (TPR) repeat protein
MADLDQPTPDQDVALARQALALGDLPHALHHVGCALASDPTRQEWMQLLAEVVGQARDPLTLVTLDGDTSFVDGANRAYCLAWARQWEEALDLITDVAEVRPDIPYLLWAEWWFAQHGVAQSLTFDQLAGGILVDLAKIASRCPIPTPADDPRLPNLHAAARILGHVRGLHAGEAFVWFTSALVGRRLGTLDDALGFAQRAYQIEPAWKNAIGVANVLRDQRQLDEAARWYRRALDHDPEDVSALLDMGDMFLDAGRLDDAIAQYEQALRKEADQPWATASIYFARFKQTGDPTQKLCLLRLTEEGDGNARATMLAAKLDPPVAYVTYLPRPGDASCNGLNAVFEQMWKNPAAHHGSVLKLRLSHVESPSVVAAFRLQMEMWGPQVGFDYQVETIQKPDPRQPKAQVPYLLWTWDGTQPRPGLPPPDPRIRRAVQEVAGEPFAFDIWATLADKAARALGPGAAEGLLATMVHPPRPDGGRWRVLQWTQRCQVAAALIIAHLDGGWAGSVRQRALYSALYGPGDWTTGAGIVALGFLARREPAIRAEAVQAFAWLEGQVPAEGFCAWEYPLVSTWLALGGHDEATRVRLERWRDRILDEKGKSTVHLCRLEAKKFDQAAEMQRAAEAQAELAAGSGGDPDPVVFPGQRVAKLSDYVGIMKGMQTGNMMGALSSYGLDMMSYAQVATAWGQKLAGDPVLNAKFAAMMAG